MIHLPNRLLDGQNVPFNKEQDDQLKELIGRKWLIINPHFGFGAADKHLLPFMTKCLSNNAC